MVAPGHPLAKRRRVSLAAVADEPLIAPITGASLRLALEEALEAVGASVRVSYESNEAATVRALTAQGLGVSVLPRSFASRPGPEIVAVPIAPKLPRIPISVLYRDGRRRPPAVEAFLTGLREELSAA
jgi:DNA-binding transcriptional LysR family regulator